MNSGVRGPTLQPGVDICFIPTVYRNGKNQGKNTCPICRKIIDGTQFKITVTSTEQLHSNGEFCVLE